MIGITQIDHINMRVRNLNESIDFYARLFGFEMKEDRRGDQEPWAIIGLKDVAYLCLYEHPGKDIPREGLTINHFGLVLADFDEALAKLKEYGVPILYGGPVDWPKSRSIYITDPNGHEIELAEYVGGRLG
ncbi:MAG: VOC family protein [candidate division Zixibacteria bacterium]|nr:VOC family protein [candidate division Zixibacteria bacterium]